MATYVYRKDLDGRYKVEDTGYSLSDLQGASNTISSLER